MPWRLAAVDPAAPSVTVDYVTGDGDCVRPVGLRVQESSTAVVLTLLSRTDPRRQSCATRLVVARSVVPLQEALGDRRLVHAATDADWRLP
jgi:hypothetical protein